MTDQQEIKQRLKEAQERDKKHYKLIAKLEEFNIISVLLVIIIVIVIHFTHDILRLALLTLAVNLIFLPMFIKENVKYSYMKKHGIKTKTMVTNVQKVMRVLQYSVRIELSDSYWMPFKHSEYRPWLKPKTGDIIKILYLFSNPQDFIWIKEFKVKRRCNIALTILINFIFLLLWIVALR